MHLQGYKIKGQYNNQSYFHILATRHGKENQKQKNKQTKTRVNLP